MKNLILDPHHWVLLKRFYFFLKPHSRLWWIAVLLMLIAFAFSFPMPWISMKVVDEVVQNKETGLFGLLLGGWAIAIVLRLLVEILQGHTLMRFQLAAGQDIRVKIFQHLYHLPISYFSDKQTGYLISRIFRDVEDAANILGARLISILQGSISLIFGIIVIFLINWKLSLLSLALIPFYLVNQVFNKKIRARDTDKREEWAKVSGLLIEGLSEVYSVKAYTMEESEVERFDTKSRVAIQKSMESWLTMQFPRSIVGLVRGLAPIVVFSYAGYLIFNEAMTIGELIGFAGYTGLLYGPASGLFSYLINLQVAAVSLDRIFEILDTSSEEQLYDAVTTNLPQKIQGDIKFENIYFQYNDQESGFRLKKFNLSISQGETVGIVGRSGSGKTTMVNLLLKLYIPQEGKICIDGIDIKNIPLKSLRKYICIVPQEPFLFSGTLYENILFGKPDARKTQIIEASRLANAHNFISTFPKGYATEVGEKGVGLSGGQKQMISIARAFLRNPSILILDEATSAVDSQSEHLIKKALKMLMENRTSIVVSHRLSSLLNVNKIVVLKDGEIVEEGTHQELHAGKSYYQRLFNEQIMVKEENSLSDVSSILMELP